jgi:hypothetical protein
MYLYDHPATKQKRFLERVIQSVMEGDNVL